MHTEARTVIENRWDDRAAAGLSEPELLRYRSNLLGADLRITNYGGGNTSAKIPMRDPLTGDEDIVLWVKGSGGDLGSMGLDGFATLYLKKLEQLKRLYRGIAHEDEMVGYLPYCTFGVNPRAASIDTPLHAFVPHPHVDHLHPDAVIAIAASRDGEALTREVFGGRIGWLPWQRPGFDLGLRLEALCREHPDLEGVILGQHGLFTWGPTSKACYERSLAVIQRAADFLADRAPAHPFGTPRQGLAADRRRAIVASLAPVLRGKLGTERRKVMHYSDDPAVLEFVNGERLGELARLGTSCPDHFLRTKIWPLVVPFEPDTEDPATVERRLDGLIEGYRTSYAAYYDRCRHPDSPPMRDPMPVIVLVPGLGLLSFAADKTTARIAAEFYTNAINVMRGASAVSEYVALDEQEAFDIEYWSLEEAKLRRLPPRRPLEGQVALVTGGAGGIGRATAARLLDDGACVVVADIDAGRLEETAADLAKRGGRDRVRTAVMDVTSETAVARAFEHAALEFGGIDILVSNAGIASAAPYDETTLALWQRNLDILATGYFLVSRSAFGLMKRQGTGGSIVFVASKNGLAASANAAAYCTAKAAEIHLARCLALEGAAFGVRVNVVNPDAVLQGSTIWGGEWRRERAAAYGIDEADLEEFYRKRSLLKRSVLPEDVAEAIRFFVSSASEKSTGNILNVDAGHAVAFTR